MDICLDSVWKTYPSGNTAVRDLSLDIASGSTLCLIGTSGCGKTTTLKMINRLIEPTLGDIQIGGADILQRDVFELRRSIGYVIQKGGLFPHKTVAENIGIVGKLEGWEDRRIGKRVDDLLRLVDLPPEEFRERYPTELSGGQQQRVGVVRALMVDPPIILMDEPFGALDPITREGVQNEFVKLKRELGKTIVIVTHDMSEAFKLGDSIAIMDAGEIQQVGSPSELLSHPANDFVEEFVRSHAHHPPPHELTADDVMVGDAVSVPQETSRWPSIDTLKADLERKGMDVLFVVDDKRRLQGLIAEDDLEDVARSNGDGVSPWMKMLPEDIHTATPVSEVIDVMLRDGLNELPVVDENRYLLGAITREGLVDYFKPPGHVRQSDR